MLKNLTKNSIGTTAGFLCGKGETLLAVACGVTGWPVFALAVGAGMFGGYFSRDLAGKAGLDKYTDIEL